MRKRRTQNRGYILLDALIVMTVTVTVLSLSSVWIYKTLRYSSEVNQRVQHVRSISRVGHLLRSDVLDASSLSVEGEVLSLRNAEREIRYDISGNRLKRQVEEGGGFDSPETLHRDEFEFAPNAVLGWQAVGDDAVLLNISRDFSHLAPGKEKTERHFDSQIRISVMPKESP